MSVLLLAAAFAATPADRRFPASNFDAVADAGPESVIVLPGRAFSVVATGDPDTLDKLDIRVEKGTLRIGRKSYFYFWTQSGGRPARVVVTLPVIGKAAIAGGGSMAVSHPRGPRFVGAIAGSGSLTIAGMAVDTARFAIAGSGTIVASGTATGTAAYSIAGSGTVRALNFRSRDATIKIAGEGDIMTGATGGVTGSIAGEGKVRVHGTADCSIKKAGSGQVTCLP
jgi:hypothetical protein